MRWAALVAAGCVGASLTACATRHIQTDAVPQAMGPELPDCVVTTRKTVLMTRGSRSLRLGTPRAQLPLGIDSVSADGTEAQVRLTGGIDVLAQVQRDTLGVLVCQPIDISPNFYAGAGNLLFLRSGVTDEGVRIAGEVTVRIQEWVQGQPWHTQFRTVAFAGQVPIANLCTQKPPPRHAGTDADPFVATMQGEADIEDFAPGTEQVEIPAGTTVTVLASPGGEPLVTRAASPWSYRLARLGTQGGWDRVAVGDGPYLVGWLPTRPAWRKGAEGVGGVLGGLGLRGMTGPFALHTTALARWPLHALPAGTVLQQYGVEVARLTRPGYARASTLRGGWQYVVAAVDGDVVVEGWIDPASLGEKIK